MEQDAAFRRRKNYGKLKSRLLVALPQPPLHFSQALAQVGAQAGQESSPETNFINIVALRTGNVCFEFP